MKKQIVFLCILTVFVMSCGRRNKSPKTQAQLKYEEVMDDHSYAGIRKPNSETSRINANGREVRFSSFSGKFVWADYSAPQCEPCRFQGRIIKKLEKAYPGEIVFLSVMTSNSQRYEDIPNQDTARTWAGKYQLEPEHVLVATNLWAITIPRHILFSPEG